MTIAGEFPREVLEILKASNRVVVMTGAGISAESGVPTFRQAQTGLWAKYDPSQLATPEAFQRDPKLVWDWYTWRRDLISRSIPNRGHLALVDLESYYPEFTLITQNVDGLHRQAGSTRLIELHGNIFRTKCSRDGRLIADTNESPDSPPLCPDCGSFLRPDVVWFGESLASGTLKKALEGVESCQVFISIGTSTLIEPAASVPFLALQKGATVIEINPQATPLTPMSHHLFRANAGDVLPDLTAEILS